MTRQLPEPACPLGYTNEQLAEIFQYGSERQAFDDWMYGQTRAICDEHGGIAYASDVRRYFNRVRVWD